MRNGIRLKQLFLIRSGTWSVAGLRSRFTLTKLKQKQKSLRVFLRWTHLLACSKINYNEASALQNDTICPYLSEQSIRPLHCPRLVQLAHSSRLPRQKTHPPTGLLDSLELSKNIILFGKWNFAAVFRIRIHSTRIWIQQKEPQYKSASGPKKANNPDPDPNYFFTPSEIILKLLNCSKFLSSKPPESGSRKRPESRSETLLCSACSSWPKISVLDPDPHGSETFAWIRIRNYSSASWSCFKWKSIHIKLWILDYFYYWTEVINREGQIVVKILLLDWMYFALYLINIGWIRIRNWIRN